MELLLMAVVTKGLIVRFARAVGSGAPEWTPTVKRNGGDTLEAVMTTARAGIAKLGDSARMPIAFRKGRLRMEPPFGSTETLPERLMKEHRINVEAGFEGNNGIKGGVWRHASGNADALVYLRFTAGTMDLPLHIHEHSDRFIIAASGFGLFHYVPPDGLGREIRSILIEAGDVVAFTRGLLHTFTAPISDLVLLSYHSPFLELNDVRQFTVPKTVLTPTLEWKVGALMRRAS